jgi:tRNA A37 threonylcarbamoyladenosine biosynthesis protein TsaE
LWLQELERETPNTEEMQIAFDEITRAIMIGETAFFCIRGVGGAGKTNFAKKVVNFKTHKI